MLLLPRRAHQAAALLDDHLQRILPGIVTAAHGGAPVFQQEAAGRQPVHDAHDEQRHAQPGDVEHPQRPGELPQAAPGGRNPSPGEVEHAPRPLEPLGDLLVYQPGHDHVGARADQRAQAPEHDGGVHWHQELRDAEPVLAGPLADRRHEQGHHRGVVHERRDDARADHRAELGRGERPWPPQDPLDDHGQRPGPLHAGGHDEQRGHRDHALVGHALERLGGAEDPGQHQDHDAADHDHVGGPLDEQQPQERGHDDRRGKHRLPVCREGLESHAGSPGPGCEWCEDT